jgi:hypothetical protein
MHSYSMQQTAPFLIVTINGTYIFTTGLYTFKQGKQKYFLLSKNLQK